MNKERYPSPDGIKAASATINPIFLCTPLVEQASANEAPECRLLAKVETLNPIRCFKGRGAGWWIANLPKDGQPIVTASAGNFGQGLRMLLLARGTG